MIDWLKQWPCDPETREQIEECARDRELAQKHRAKVLTFDALRAIERLRVYLRDEETDADKRTAIRDLLTETAEVAILTIGENESAIIRAALNPLPLAGAA